MPDFDYRAYAHQLLNNGYAPLPVKPDGTKSPAVMWTRYQHTPPTHDEIDRWFGPLAHADGLGVLCGAVSGNLEMLEVEARAVTDGTLTGYVTALTDHDAAGLWERLNTGWVEVSPSGGMHWHYRVGDAPAAGNTKLARDQDGLVLIETRGEGGFTVLAPSAGRTHPSGAGWVTVTGGPGTVPTISSDERDLLFAVATMSDRTPESPEPAIRALVKVAAGSDRPGDDYNQKASWDDILGARGWRKVLTFAGGGIGWQRPDKPGPGISATTGRNPADNLYVFSTSTVFDTEHPYSKFAATALLDYGGDYSAAARALAGRGYGTPNGHGSVTDLLPPGADGHTTGRGGEQQHRGQPRIAYRLAASYAGKLMHVTGLGWMHYNGTRWLRDTTGVTTRAVLDVLRAALHDAADLEKVERERLTADARRCESASGVAGVLKIAEALPPFPREVTDLDADPYLLNCANGTLDLRTLRLRGHDPADRCTKITRAAYHPDVTSDVWDAFLARILPDMTIRGYLQRFAGLALLGKVIEHIFAIATGTGGNGKGKTYGAFLHTLGDYGHAAEMDLFMQAKANPNTASPALMSLQGKRLVVVSETEEGHRLAVALMKNLTGGDSITARALYEAPVTFPPSHTTLMVTNYLPKVPGDDLAVWRRIRVIPFDVTIPEEDRDVHMEDKLELAADAILAWMVTGYRQYAAGGMDEPAGVRAKTSAFQHESDAVRRFVTECCEESPLCREPIGQLWEAWLKWQAAEGVEVLSQKMFGTALDRLGHPPVGGTNRSRRDRAGLMLYRGEDTQDDLGNGWERS